MILYFLRTMIYSWRKILHWGMLVFSDIFLALSRNGLVYHKNDGTILKKDRPFFKWLIIWRFSSQLYRVTASKDFWLKFFTLFWTREYPLLFVLFQSLFSLGILLSWFLSLIGYTPYNNKLQVLFSYIYIICIFLMLTNQLSKCFI